MKNIVDDFLELKTNYSKENILIINDPDLIVENMLLSNFKRYYQKKGIMLKFLLKEIIMVKCQNFNIFNV